MAYRTVLSVLRNENEAKRVLPVAIGLARKFNAHLVAAHAEPSPIAYSTPEGFPDTDFIEKSVRESEERTEKLRTHVEKACSAEGIKPEWMSSVTFGGDSATAALPIALNSDLIIVGQTDYSDMTAGYANVEALLFESGRPVLFVPFAGEKSVDTNHAVIAWNGSRESARAVFDAMPLLKAAGKVDLLLIDARANSEQDIDTAGSDIAEALERHDVKVTIHNVRSNKMPVADVIVNFVSEQGAGLLVMGAYSHSRLREFIFGGTTRTVLNTMPTLTLMAH